MSWLSNLARGVRDIFDAIWYNIVMKCDDCETKPIAKKLCNRHYLQMKRHGRLIQSSREDRGAVFKDGEHYLPLGVGAKDGYVLIDERSVHLAKYKWSLSHGYPYSSAGLLHRVVMNAPRGTDVDHVDGDVFNAKRENLRLCTRAQNNMNRKVDNKTGYKGVYWHKVANKWAARIMFKRQSYHLGLYTDIQEAAVAYNKKASELFGEFARLNDV